MTLRAESEHRPHPAEIGVKAGGYDDALHIVEKAGYMLTLCGSWAESRNVVALTADLTVDLHSVCWSCAEAANRHLKALGHAA